MPTIPPRIDPFIHVPELGDKITDPRQSRFRDLNIAAIGERIRAAGAPRDWRHPDAVRAENEHLGVQLHVVAPGSIRTNVSRNSLRADGSRRGVSDAPIDAGTRELVLATREEYDVAVLRRHDPEALFDRMSAVVRDGYARKMAADSGRG